MNSFKLVSPYQPTGDQPTAINALVDGMKEAVPSYRRQHIETNERALRAGWDAATAGAAPVWEDAA